MCKEGSGWTLNVTPAGSYSSWVQFCTFVLSRPPSKRKKTKVIIWRGVICKPSRYRFEDILWAYWWWNYLWWVTCNESFFKQAVGLHSKWVWLLKIDHMKGRGCYSLSLSKKVLQESYKVLQQSYKVYSIVHCYHPCVIFVLCYVHDMFISIPVYSLIVLQ